MERYWARAVKQLPGIVEEYAYPNGGSVVRTLLVYREHNQEQIKKYGRWIVYFGWINDEQGAGIQNNGKYWGFRTKWMAKRYAKRIVKLYPRYDLDEYKNPFIIEITYQTCRTCLEALYELSSKGIEKLVQFRRRLFLKLNKKLIEEIRDETTDYDEGYK